MHVESLFFFACLLVTQRMKLTWNIFKSLNFVTAVQVSRKSRRCFFSSVKVTPVSSAHLQSTKRRRIEIRTADGIKICIIVVLEKSEARSKEHERGGRAMKKKVKIKTECDYGR
jgi:hypothetical protein